MAKQSAGILLYRYRQQILEVLLVHPGPFFAKKDAAAWSIPKGEFTDEEDAFDAAQREFKEETGVAIKGNSIKLAPIKQAGGKIVNAWAVKGDLDAANVKSNTFKMEWPPKSGNVKEFPEIDKACWFTVTEAKEKILKGQLPLIDELIMIAV